MHKNRLQQYFPILPARLELEATIRANPYLNATFESWTPEQQQEFLDFCTGERGLKILYDVFFREVFNPEYAPERLEELLSLIMRQTVKIIKVIPNDSTRIAGEASLLITDIVVELADHSVANIEIQKIGYMFPGQRSACYSADLLLRQYKRVRSAKKKSFSYKHIQKAYTIIFFERCTEEFHSFPQEYLHHFTQQSDTGLELNLLQEYFFIPLDIFRKNIQNKGIKTKLDAWLTFLTSDDPERILELLQAFPEFKALYEDIYELCRNIEEVMHMFSKELQELDRNTVQYMIDVMQDEIDASRKQLFELDEQLNEKNQQLNKKNQQLDEKNQQLDEINQLLKYQEAVNHLYVLLSQGGRVEELSRAVTDELQRNQLLKEYQLI